MSRAYLTRTAGDFGDKYTISLKEDDGTASNLTGATQAKFSARLEGGTFLAVNKAISILSPVTNGQVEYQVAAADLDIPGLYFCQVEMTFPTRVTTYDVMVLSVQRQNA